MTDIIIQTKLNGVAVNGLAVVPVISIFRIVDDVEVVNDSAMSDMGGGGLYKFSFIGEPGFSYAFQVDADPSATGQTDDRTYGGAFDNEVNDIWNDRGLNPNNPKEITENVEGSDYTEEVPDLGTIVELEKFVVKAGSVTTITRNA